MHFLGTTVSVSLLLLEHSELPPPFCICMARPSTTRCPTHPGIQSLFTVLQRTAPDFVIPPPSINKAEANLLPFPDPPFLQGWGHFLDYQHKREEIREYFVWHSIIPYWDGWPGHENPGESQDHSPRQLPGAQSVTCSYMVSLGWLYLLASGLHLGSQATQAHLLQQDLFR